MAWVTPKTNWKRDDYFNVNPDWARIKNNMLEIQRLARPLFWDITLEAMPDVGIADFPYANVLNSIENNLQTLMDKTFGFAEFRQSEPRHHNGPVWDYADLNRIESMQLRVYELLQKCAQQRTAIPFILGGGNFAEGLA